LATVEGLSNYEMLDIKQIPIYDEYRILETLQDGVAIFEALCMMEPNIFYVQNVCHDEDDSYQAYRNFKQSVDGLQKFYEGLHGI
jgi:transcription termination factor NusB